MPDENEVPEIVNNLIIQIDKFDGVNELLEKEVRKASEEWRKQNRVYPYKDGEYTVLGPEVFTDGKVVCWQGEIYVPQGYLPPTIPVPGSEQ